MVLNLHTCFPVSHHRQPLDPNGEVAGEANEHEPIVINRRRRRIRGPLRGRGRLPDDDAVCWSSAISMLSRRPNNTLPSATTTPLFAPVLPSSDSDDTAT